MSAERREPSSPNMFQIRAMSVVVSEDSYKNEYTFTIFRPEAETLERLRQLKAAQVMGQIALIDKWDDGTEDVLESLTLHQFISLKLASRHGMKQSSWKLMTRIYKD
jgi:hypothetical protein